MYHGPILVKDQGKRFRAQADEDKHNWSWWSNQNSWALSNKNKEWHRGLNFKGKIRVK